MSGSVIESDWPPPGTGRPRPGGRLWPNERQELLLRAGLSPAPACIRAWEHFSRGLALETLDRGSERLLPLVWHNLRHYGVDTPYADQLEAAYRSTRARAETQLARAGEVLRTLHDQGVPTIVLKGAALLVDAYADVGLRPMSDVDVLVPVQSVVPATRVLMERGWTPQCEITPVMVRRIHSVQFTHPQGTAVDLHWHVFEECCRTDDDDDQWAASVPVTVGGAPTRSLAPEDLLLNVCVHGEKWVRIPGIRWVADALMVIRSGRVRWRRFVEQAVEHRFVLRLRAQMAYLERVFEAPIPSEAISMLAAAPESRLERFEERWSVRDRRRPWLLVYWCNHVRSATGGVIATAISFPQYLQATWHLPSVTRVPTAAVARVLRALDHRRARLLDAWKPSNAARIVQRPRAGSAMPPGP